MDAVIRNLRGDRRSGEPAVSSGARSTGVSLGQDHRLPKSGVMIGDIIQVIMEVVYAKLYMSGRATIQGKLST